MSINDAEVGDIYVDTGGKLWRITSVVREPTIEAEEVEGTLWDPNAPPPMGAAQGAFIGQAMASMPRASINKTRRARPSGDSWWDGWRRIWRKDQP